MNTNQLTTITAVSVTPPSRSTIVFDHAEFSHPIRTDRDQNGDLMWVARDVCGALGITKPSRALERVNASDKGRTKLSTPGGPQDFVTVNRSGLYALAFQSRKPAAMAFQHWVTSTVLPAIDADGAYIKGEENLARATTRKDLEEQQRALEVTAAQAIEVKAHRGLCGIEEREARSAAFHLKGGGRRRRKVVKPRGKRGDI